MFETTYTTYMFRKTSPLEKNMRYIHSMLPKRTGSMWSLSKDAWHTTDSSQNLPGFSEMIHSAGGKKDAVNFQEFSVEDLTKLDDNDKVH